MWLRRRRLLRAKGWTVLSVPYFEWYVDGDRESGIIADRVRRHGAPHAGLLYMCCIIRARNHVWQLVCCRCCCLKLSGMQIHMPVSCVSP